jgi:hypothetical protein
MPTSSNRDPERTGPSGPTPPNLHQAARAVVATALGVRFDLFALNSSEARTTYHMPNGDDSTRTQAILRLLGVMTASAAFEEMFRGGDISDKAKEDLAEAMALVRRYGMAPGNEENTVRWYKEKARELLADYLPAVLEIAGALTTQGRLEEGEIISIFARHHQARP